MTQNSINSQSPVIQYLYASTATVFTLNDAIPRSDAIPVNTDGVEVITLAITPKSTTTKLLIEFDAQSCDPSGTATATTCALFQDTTVNSLAAVNVRSAGADAGESLNIRYIMTSGTTSSTTFKIRCGPDVTSSFINANGAGTRLMGGVSFANLSITEYLA